MLTSLGLRFWEDRAPWAAVAHRGRRAPRPSCALGGRRAPRPSGTAAVGHRGRHAPSAVGDPAGRRTPRVELQQRVRPERQELGEVVVEHQPVEEVGGLRETTLPCPAEPG